MQRMLAKTHNALQDLCLSAKTSQIGVYETLVLGFHALLAQQNRGLLKQNLFFLLFVLIVQYGGIRLGA